MRKWEPICINLRFQTNCNMARVFPLKTNLQSLELLLGLLLGLRGHVRVVNSTATQHISIRAKMEAHAHQLTLSDHLRHGLDPFHQSQSSHSPSHGAFARPPSWPQGTR